MPVAGGRVHGSRPGLERHVITEDERETLADKDIEINIGATIPFMQQYWQYHYGSVMGQFYYFL